MASSQFRDALRQIHRLFTVGAVAALSDASLVRRFADGRDEEAFGALVARHGPMVLSVCQALLRDPRDVEDAFQATFLVLVRRAGSVRVDGSLGGWLYRVASRIALQARADAARRRARESPRRGDRGDRGGRRDARRGPGPRASRGDRPSPGIVPAGGRALRPRRDDPGAGRPRTPLRRGDPAPPTGRRPGTSAGPGSNAAACAPAVRHCRRRPLRSRPPGPSFERHPAPRSCRPDWRRFGHVVGRHWPPRLWL